MPQQQNELQLKTRAHIGAEEVAPPMRVYAGTVEQLDEAGLQPLWLDMPPGSHIRIGRLEINGPRNRE